MAEPESCTTTDGDENQNTNTDKFYVDAKEYWDGVSASLDGMLGGFAKISPTDLDGSRAFLRPFLKVGGGKTDSKRALDCGAGIGRITKRLLLPMFETADMVELSQKFLDKAPGFIGADFKRVDRLFCCGLQDFTPDPGHYDVIWCQWVLGHLKDDHLVEFFKRCQAGLKPDGILVVKENVTSGTQLDFDKQDSSYTRAYSTLLGLMLRAGLKVQKEEKQKGFPKGLYDVYMFALR